MTRFPRLDRLRDTADQQPNTAPAATREDGFILLESMIAISLITVIMSALGMLFLNTVATTSHEKTRATAVQVATTTLENLRSHDATSLVSGRDSTSVGTQFAASQATSGPVQNYLSQLTQAVDSSAAIGAGASASVPTGTTTKKVGPITYKISQYLGWCYNTVAVDGAGSCVQTPVGSAVQYLAAVVAVSWTAPRCTPSSCTYVTSALISAKTDPTFDMNQPLPAAPVVASPGNQTNAVNDTVNLQMAVQDGTGVPTYTWSTPPVGQPGALPTGLNINVATGVISGVPTVPNSSPASVTVTVTDAYGRQASKTFTWRIYPPLTADTPGPQSNLTTDQVSLTLNAHDGAGAPYTWSLKTGSIPPGLTLNASTGTITGQPTTPGQYTFTLQVADKSTTRTVTTGAITWTVTYPPLGASNPGNRTDTIGSSPRLQLSASGGSGSYVWSDPTNSLAAAGLSISSNGKITGTPANAGTFPISVTVNDPTAGPDFTQSVTFSWNIVAKPTVDGPGTRAMSETASPSVPLSYTCPNGPCRIDLSNAPPGLGLSTSATNNSPNNTPTLSNVATGSGTVYVNGVVANSAVQSGNSKVYQPSVSIRDNDSIATTPNTGTWTVNVAPTLAVTPAANNEFPLGAAISGQATAGPGTGPYTYTISGNPNWLSINAGTGAISGNPPTGRSAAGPMTVTATDASGATATKTFSWYVDDLAWKTIPNQTTPRGSGTVSFDVAPYRTGGASSYTYSLVSPPGWITQSGSTIKANTANMHSATAITVSVTDSKGCTVTTSFTWTIT